jgi:thiol-disulfide isomerase/thioredoxin
MATSETVTAENGEPVTLRLQPNALLTLSGQVQDDRGLPLPNAKVTLIEWQLDMGHSGLTITTDAHGRYTFAGLFPDSRYSVIAQAAGHGQHGTEVNAFSPGAKAELGALRLPLANFQIAGRVVDEQSNPLARQSLTIDGMTGAPQDTLTDARGRFRFDGVANGAFRLYLREDDGSTPTTKLVHAGETDVVLVRKSAPATKSDMEQQQEVFEKRRAALKMKQGPELKAAAWLNTSGTMPGSLRGKIVVIDFWATSCGPCVASLPAVQRLSDQYAGRNVVVIGLHGAGMSRDKLASYVKEHHLTYPFAIDAEDPEHAGFGKTTSSYGVFGIPTVAVLDRKGVVRYLDFGLEGAAATIGTLLQEEKQSQ